MRLVSLKLQTISLLERFDSFLRLFRLPVVEEFGKLFYLLRRNTFDQTFFFGKHVLKFPTDLWSYQEILHDCKPDLIIETGTFFGGSTFYLAKLCDLFERGRVVSIDTCHDHVYSEVLQHPRISLITGSSTAPEILEMVRSLIREGDRVMVILDSDHREEHVLKELEAYSSFVSEGQYLIAEDGIVDSIYPKKMGKGPLAAILTFLSRSRLFTPDYYRSRFLLTLCPSGYLYRTPAGETKRIWGPMDCLRPLRLWLPGAPPPDDVPWMKLINQAKKVDPSSQNGA